MDGHRKVASIVPAQCHMDKKYQNLNGNANTTTTVVLLFFRYKNFNLAGLVKENYQQLLLLLLLCKTHIRTIMNYVINVFIRTVQVVGRLYYILNYAVITSNNTNCGHTNAHHKLHSIVCLF